VGVRPSRRRTAFHFIDLTVTPERPLKTASSARRVPLHPVILRAGLLDYAATVPQDGRLFPELKKGIHGQYGRTLTKFWRPACDPVRSRVAAQDVPQWASLVRGWRVGLLASRWSLPTTSWANTTPASVPATVDLSGAGAGRGDEQLEVPWPDERRGTGVIRCQSEQADP